MHERHVRACPLQAVSRLDAEQPTANHDDAFTALSWSGKPLNILQRAKDFNARKLSARKIQPDRLRASRKDTGIKIQRSIVGKSCRF